MTNSASATLDLADSRVSAGIILSGVGRGGDTLTETAIKNYGAFGDPDFRTMTEPAMIIYGDADQSEHLTVAGPTWHADPYHLAPAPKTLLTRYGAGHGLGGVSGYDAAETTDENPARVEHICQLISAYLYFHLGIDPDAWSAAVNDFNTLTPSVGQIDE